MTLTDQDIKQLAERGISQEQVKEQFHTLKKGIPHVDLRKAASQENGIIVLTLAEQETLVQKFESKKSSLALLKFTPASGAATRMFKFLFEFFEDYDNSDGSINAYINKRGVPELRLFFVGIDSFPFFKKVRKRLKKKYSKKESTDIDVNRLRFVNMMLAEDELNFGKRPKGLFPFHAYKNHVATAFEEHLFEAALYATNDNIARLHFTISTEHQQRFERQFEKRKTYIKKKTGVDFDISYSSQAASTDTIAVNSKNEVLRDSNGALIFRPGGHGALINNLNNQEADIIFIKNIDNVVVNKYKEEVAFYKKVLAGKLLELQEQSFKFLRQLYSENVNNQTIDASANFLQDELCTKLSTDFKKFSNNYKIEYLAELLDRPLRVCGMVKNEGEPGGGPFWVKHENGVESLQIIESVQINTKNERQRKIVEEATHFNPVDIVCGVKNYKGEKFNLLQYVDKKAGFIATKSYEDQKIKALEHPGLWNGGMAHWNTIFIEVPLVTFNPVKTVNDLLKPAHQVK